VWHDAKHVADHIATQRKYLEYRDAEQREAELHACAQQSRRHRRRLISLFRSGADCAGQTF
jgi:hypothetical protein